MQTSWVGVPSASSASYRERSADSIIGWDASACNALVAGTTISETVKCAGRCATFGCGTVSFRVGPGHPVTHDRAICSGRSQNAAHFRSRTCACHAGGRGFESRRPANYFQSNASADHSIHGGAIYSNHELRLPQRAHSGASPNGPIGGDERQVVHARSSRNEAIRRILRERGAQLL